MQYRAADSIFFYSVLLQDKTQQRLEKHDSFGDKIGLDIHMYHVNRLPLIHMKFQALFHHESFET